jgi:hypothetical protein
VIDILSSLGESSLDLHSSIVLTYSFDLVLYDGLIRRRLRQAGVVNQIVFSDFHKYQEQLNAVTSVRYFGRSYSVTPIPQADAFHPKLYMVLGRKGGRLYIGSGNATIGGMLRKQKPLVYSNTNARVKQGHIQRFVNASSLSSKPVVMGLMSLRSNSLALEAGLPG